MLANSLRAHCAEFGIVVAQGMAKLAELLARIADEGDLRIPPLARGCLLVLARQLQELQLKIGEVERALHAWHRSQGRPGSTDWAVGLLQRRPFKLVAVALANKTARIAWAVLARGETYRSRPETCAA